MSYCVILDESRYLQCTGRIQSGENQKSSRKYHCSQGLEKETEEEVAPCARWGKCVPANKKTGTYRLSMSRCSDLLCRWEHHHPQPRLCTPTSFHLPYPRPLPSSELLQCPLAYYPSLPLECKLCRVRAPVLSAAVATVLRTPPSTW